MNVFQRGYLAFALVALIMITLYSGQVAAGTMQQCGYHFSPTSSKGKGACKHPRPPIYQTAVSQKIPHSP
jgi:hypothetical protein